MIEFRCKNCRQKIVVQDQYSGKKVRCPKCDDVCVVPDVAGKIIFYCDSCNQKMTVSQVHAGKKGKCPRCKNPVVVPETGGLGLEGSKADSEKPNIDMALLEVPKESKAPQEQTSRAEGLSTGYEGLAGYGLGQESDEDERTGERKLPWLIDIFLYPISRPCLTVVGIIVLVPILIDVLIVLSGPFGFFIAIPGMVIRYLIFIYLYWYVIECVRDSALGGVRAPDTTATTPDIGDLFWQFVRLVGCLAFFIAPVSIYWFHARQTDVIFWLLAGYAVFFFPMGLLAMVMFDSISALSPVLLIQSIFSTFFQYFWVVLISFGVVISLVFARLSLQKYYLLGWVFYLFRIYAMLIWAHLLGRFYWRYQEKLYWEV